MVDGQNIPVYLPNPGRLWELLTPGVLLYLSANRAGSAFPYTVVAVDKGGIPVLLHTHLTNAVTEVLLREKLIPGFEDMEIVRREASLGESRFDFLLRDAAGYYYLEVKNCTLFHNKLAMFPDAVTARGSRHLKGLSKAAGKGLRSGALFVVNWPYARFFMPEYHTDLVFSETLLAVRDRIDIKAVGLKWSRDLSLDPAIVELIIPWDTISRNVKDSGCYIVVLKLENNLSIRVGELGQQSFRKGYYLYVGSAKRALTKRMNRHGRIRKNFHWHIDYLRNTAIFQKALPVRSPDDLECLLARSIGSIAGWSVKGFGSSDCACKSHLFGMENDPIRDQRFVEILYDYRIGRVERELVNADH